MISLLFLGDIAISEPLSWPYGSHEWPSSADLVVANLEGPIASPQDLAQNGRANLALYNSADVLDTLRTFSVGAVCLANNHMYDLPAAGAQTRDRLARAGIASFGAGANLAEASQAFTFSSAGTIVKVFAFGWEVIGCRPATPTRQGVNPLRPAHMLDTICRLRAIDPDSFVVFMVHWNYELELYPQPAHRQLAHTLVQEGVDAIVGLHSHVVQGAELVNGKPIVYGLGNWLFPPRQLGSMHLSYPPIASRELALQLEVEGRAVQNTLFHWYRFDAETTRVHLEKTERWDGATRRQLTPYSDMSHKVFTRWFRDNRTRRRGLPIYEDYRKVWRNRIKNIAVGLRQALIRMLVRLRLKKGLG